MSELKLLNCPFCGGMAELKTADRTWDNQLYCATWVECEVCHSKSKEVWNTIYNDKPNEREKEVIDIWNRRKPMANIAEKLEEKTEFLKDCTKYGNKNAEQQEKSYSTMMMYEVAGLVDDLIDIVKQEINKEN